MLTRETESYHLGQLLYHEEPSPSENRDDNSKYEKVLTEWSEDSEEIRRTSEV